MEKKPPPPPPTKSVLSLLSNVIPVSGCANSLEGDKQLRDKGGQKRAPDMGLSITTSTQIDDVGL